MTGKTDEAHRVSGQAGKPWAAILDNTRIPCDRRLFMTATPRLWAVRESDRGRVAAAGIESAELIASMDDEALFGPVAHDYPLGTAISDGVIAPYRIVCVDVSDPVLQGLEQHGAEMSVEYRGARLAALQTALLTAAAEWDLARVLSFHHFVAEARALSTGLRDVARVLWEQDPAPATQPGPLWFSGSNQSRGPCGSQVAGTFVGKTVGHVHHQCEGEDGGAGNERRPPRVVADPAPHVHAEPVPGDLGGGTATMQPARSFSSGSAVPSSRTVLSLLVTRVPGGCRMRGGVWLVARRAGRAAAAGRGGPRRARPMCAAGRGRPSGCGACRPSPWRLG
ncbi:hypothetical protein BX265_7056 [Streptomyces sp. TLI_235]|nr:hypothetical protein BX265_7056 [Streptomyces sp. TLI_235]